MPKKSVAKKDQATVRASRKRPGTGAMLKAPLQQVRAGELNGVSALGPDARAVGKFENLTNVGSNPMNPIYGGWEETLITHSVGGGILGYEQHPNPPYGGQLMAISDGADWTVGYRYQPLGWLGWAQRTFIMRRSGGVSWTVVPSPNPVLEEPWSTPGESWLRGVAGSRRRAWAVGIYGDFNSAAWFAVPRRRLILTWDGSSWTITPRPVLGVGEELYAVAALKDATAWAVGRRWDAQQRLLIEHFDGAAWHTVTTILDSAPGVCLYGVHFLSPNYGWAVGTLRDGKGDYPLTMHYDGITWHVVASAGRGILRGVWCRTPNDVWAVGWGTIPGVVVRRPFIIHWDGSKWSTGTTPLFPAQAQLNAVRGTDATNVWAVGRQWVPVTPQSGYFRTLGMRWDGISWKRVSSSY